MRLIIAFLLAVTMSFSGIANAAEAMHCFHEHDSDQASQEQAARVGCSHCEHQTDAQHKGKQDTTGHASKCVSSCCVSGCYIAAESAAFSPTGHSVFRPKLALMTIRSASYPQDRPPKTLL